MVKISDEVINEIREKVDIVEVVGERIPLVKKGNNMFCVCPFHDDHKPSMSVSKEKKMFTCWTCHEHGDVITFVSKFDNISWPQAAIKMAERIGIIINQELTPDEIINNRLYKVMAEATSFYRYYLHNTEEGLKALEYLHNRNINDELIEQFKIGLAPSFPNVLFEQLKQKGVSELDMMELGLITDNQNDMFRNRIIFPLDNSYGQTCGFSGRIYTNIDQSKYMNSKEMKIFHKGDILYNLYHAKKSASELNQIILCEGFMDVIAFHQAGIENAVATMGTALTQSHIKQLLKITKNIVLCFDGDQAGINAMRHSTELLLKVGIIPQAVILPNNLDPDEYLRKYGSNELQSYIRKNTFPVFEWFYRLAFNNLNKSDFNSVERFKNDVFLFLNIENNLDQTVIEYYLKKLSSDIDVSIDALKFDFNKYKNANSVLNHRPEYYNENVISSNINNTKNIKKTLPKRIYKAYQFVVLYLIFNPDKWINYNDKIGNFYVDELNIPFSIILAIKEFYASNHSSIPEENFSKKLIDHLRENSQFNDYLQNVFNIIYDKNNMDIEFKESLDTIDAVKIEKDSDRFYEKVKMDSNNQESINNFIKNRQKEPQNAPKNKK